MELFDLHGAGVEDLAGGEILAVRNGRVGAVEEGDHEIRDLAFGYGRAFGALGLAPDPPALDRRDDREDDQRQQRSDGAPDQGPVADRELAHLVKRAGWPGFDGL